MTSSLKPFHGSPWSSDELACFLSFRFCSSLPGRLHHHYPRPYGVFPLWLSAVPGTWDQLPWTPKMNKPHSSTQLRHHCIHKHLPETPSVLCPQCALPAPLLRQFSRGTHLMYVCLPDRLCIYWESNLVDFCVFITQYRPWNPERQNSMAQALAGLRSWLRHIRVTRLCTSKLFCALLSWGTKWER